MLFMNHFGTQLLSCNYIDNIVNFEIYFICLIHKYNFFFLTNTYVQVVSLTAYELNTERRNASKYKVKRFLIVVIPLFRLSPEVEFEKYWAKIMKQQIIDFVDRLKYSEKTFARCSL